MRQGERLGHFEILAPLGAGGMGQVWRARDLELKREVALKLLPDELAADDRAMARFRREAELMAAVEHPNIAAIHSIGTAERSGSRVQFLVLELVEGRTLAEILAEGPLAIADALQIGAQVARALATAHERGVVHRDLKPANVMLGPRRRVKVLDFGIAKALASPPSSRNDWAEAPTALDVTATGMLVGTAPYMSPEQVRGATVDARTDVWALGCLVYEMLTGQRAFAGRAPGEILTAIVAQEPRWDLLPVQLPDAAEKMLRECLAKDVEQRTWTAAEARRAMETLATGEIREIPRSRQVGVPSPAAATVVAALVIAAAAAWYLRPEAPATAAGPTVLTEIGSIAVLPSTLENGVDEVFRGVHEGLTNHLAGLQGVVVKRPPSELELQRFDGDLQRLAEAYDVDAFLAPTAIPAGDSATLRLRIVEPRSGALLWAQEFHTPGAEPGALIRQAGLGTRGALRPGSAAPGPASATVNQEALAQLSYGSAYAYRYNFGRDEVDYRRAHAALQRALEIDPMLADAAAELSFLSQYYFESGVPAAQQDLVRFANLAVTLDPQSALAQSAMALATLHQTGSTPAGLVPALKGATLDPDNAQTQFALGMFLIPSTDLTLAAFARAAELDPIHLFVRVNMGTVMLARGDPIERVRPHLSHARLMQPGNPWFEGEWALAELREGRRDSADQAVQSMRAVADNYLQPLPAMFEHMLAIYDAIGAADQDVIATNVDALIQLVPQMSSFQAPEIMIETIAHLARGGHDLQAEALLAASLENPQLLVPVEVYERSDLASLRGSATMQRALELAGASLEEMIAVIERARAAGEFPAYLATPYAELRTRVGMTPAGNDP